MSIILINAQDSLPLVEQVVQRLSQLIDLQKIRSGSRLPSIRQFALDHQISRFTVVQAYDRLVASGHISSRKGSGFYVNKTASDIIEQAAISTELDQAVDVLWVLKRYMQDESRRFQPGSGWLPPDWLDDQLVRRAMRQVSRGSQHSLVQYGRAQGYLPLRTLLQQRLENQGISSNVEQIITTNGVSHALDLIGRYFIRRGDVVLVDDPAYFNLFGCLQALGATIIGIERCADGPNIEQMQQALQQHKVKLFITSSVLQNPTGSCMSPANMFQLLNLADMYDFRIVDDDIYGDYHTGQQNHLATLDQLQRVIHISSFSKTISGGLRVGYIACNTKLAAELLNLKMLTCFTGSELNERLTYEILKEGLYRKHLTRLQRKLDTARVTTLNQLESLGLVPFIAPMYGYFIWARLPDRQGNITNSAELATNALKLDTIVAPGNAFCLTPGISPWMRFNVAYCQKEGAFEVLSKLIK
ncbi:MAG: PLP-dependent aminotransferase family protein [Oceanospirillaceae bacterium]